MIGKRSLALFLAGVASSSTFSRALISLPSRAFVTSAILTALRSRSVSIQAMSSFSSSSSSSSSTVRICKASDKVSFINSSVAKAIDESLMGVPGFSLDQLMELAGLSVATAVHDFYQKQSVKSTGRRRILILAGPGNNGGDGLVAARHLKHFGFDCYVVYPKKSAGQLFTNLVKQCEDLNISVSNDLTGATAAATSSDTNVAITTSSICRDFGQFDMVVDALFGFSFEGPPREPFAAMIASMAKTDVPVLSIDVPSGWHVEKGDVHDTKLIPAAVVSLTAPKECMRSYTGRHYVGGRFIPPSITAQYDLSLPDYGFGSSQVVLLDSGSTEESAGDDLDEMGGRKTLGNGDNQITALFVTASSSEEAKKIAHGLLDRKLVACVNMLPQVTSVYTWEGKVEESQEVMMIIKTRKSLVAEVTQAVKSLHSYTVPETIAFPVIGGNSDYIDWVKSSTSTSSGTSSSNTKP